MSDVLQKFLNTPNRLMGGITPSEAKKMYAQSKRHFARKNLFLIEIGALIEGKDNFNIFANIIIFPLLLSSISSKKLLSIFNISMLMFFNMLKDE